MSYCSNISSHVVFCTRDFFDFVLSPVFVPFVLLFHFFCSGVILDYLLTQLCLSVPAGLAPSAFYWCFGLIMGCILYR